MIFSQTVSTVLMWACSVSPAFQSGLPAGCVRSPAGRPVVLHHHVLDVPRAPTAHGLAHVALPALARAYAEALYELRFPAV